MASTLSALAALRQRQATEAQVLESSLKQLSKAPRFGKAPSAAALAAATELAAGKRTEMAARHEAEVAALEALGTMCAAADEGAARELGPADPVARPSLTPAVESALAISEPPAATRSRAERRRERKEERAAADASETDAPADARGAKVLSPRDAEIADLRAQLVLLRLDIKTVPGDGHCLYRSVSHQLALISGGGVPASDAHLALRKRAADFIRTFWEEFAPFLPYEPSDGHPDGAADDLNAVRSAVNRYCDRTASSAAWGGHPELRAIANVLGCPIIVFRAGAPPLQFEPRGAETNPSGAGGRNALRLTFHCAYHALGEHYNSVTPVA